MAGGVAGNATGDELVVTLTRADVFLAAAILPPLTVNTTTWSAALGLSPVGPIITSFDPVTGINSFNQCQAVAAALPDIWSDSHDIIAAIGTVSGATPFLTTVVYEVEEMD